MYYVIHVHVFCCNAMIRSTEALKQCSLADAIPKNVLEVASWQSAVSTLSFLGESVLGCWESTEPERPPPSKCSPVTSPRPAALPLWPATTSTLSSDWFNSTSATARSLMLSLTDSPDERCSPCSPGSAGSPRKKLKMQWRRKSRGWT